MQSGILHLTLHYTSQRYLNMRNKQHLIKEIVELSAVKASCNHYLASGRSIFEVENTTQLHYNLCIINKSLRELYAALKRVNGCGLIVDGSFTQTPNLKTDNQQPSTNYLLSKQFKELETRAIMQFNSDRRFTITE